MALAGKSIAEWQRRFFAGPTVWATFYRTDEGDDLAHVYESEAAALEELEWAKRLGKRGRKLPMVRKLYVHSFALSQERWQPTAAPPEGREGA